MQVVNNTDIVISNIRINGYRIIGIDGIDGAGKTTLAKELEKIGYLRISLDDYLVKKSGEYFKFLDLNKLKKDLKNKEKLVIEGVLLNKILNTIGVKTNYFIYLTDNIWLNDWLEEYDGKFLLMSLEDIIKSEEILVNRINKVTNPTAKDYKMDGLRKEIYEYSYKQKPWLLADIIIKNN